MANPNPVDGAAARLPADVDGDEAMEVDTRPTEQYSDIGGLDKQIQELIEAVVLPMTHKERFINLGIKPPKGVLMYGPPGTGKTHVVRCAARAYGAPLVAFSGAADGGSLVASGASDETAEAVEELTAAASSPQDPQMQHDIEVAASRIKKRVCQRLAQRRRSAAAGQSAASAFGRKQTLVATWRFALKVRRKLAPERLTVKLRQ